MKEEEQEKSRFMRAEDIEKELFVGRTTAYKIIKELNAQLEKKGFMIQAGRVPRQFFSERFNLKEV